MAKVEQHPSNEYFLTTGALDVTSNVTIAWIPIPAAGQVIRCLAACVAEPTGAGAITFELGGNSLQTDGSAASLTLPDADLVGDCNIIEFDQLDSANYAMEPEDGDLIAAGGVLEIISDGTPTAGEYQFTVVIRT